MQVSIEQLSLVLQKEIKKYGLASKVSSIYQIPVKNKVSERYASALFQLAKDVNKIEAVEEDLKIFYATIFSNKDVFSFFSRPFVERKSKVDMITKVFESVVNPESFNFLCILIERNIIYLLSNIVEEYSTFRSDYYNIAQVHVQSAFPINDNDSIKHAIIEASRTLAGREVDVDITVNPDLIGGITVEIDGIIYDYSVRTNLNSINKKLLNADIENIEIEAIESLGSDSSGKL